MRNKTFVEKTVEQLRSEHEALKKMAEKRYKTKKIKIIELEETINVSESGLWAIDLFIKIIQGSKINEILYNKGEAIKRPNVILDSDTILT